MFKDSLSMNFWKFLFFKIKNHRKTNFSNETSKNPRFEAHIDLKDVNLRHNFNQSIKIEPKLN